MNTPPKTAVTAYISAPIYARNKARVMMAVMIQGSRRTGRCWNMEKSLNFFVHLIGTNDEEDVGDDGDGTDANANAEAHRDS